MQFLQPLPDIIGMLGNAIYTTFTATQSQFVAVTLMKYSTEYPGYNDPAELICEYLNIERRYNRNALRKIIHDYIV